MYCRHCKFELDEFEDRAYKRVTKVFHTGLAKMLHFGDGDTAATPSV